MSDDYRTYQEPFPWLFGEAVCHLVDFDIPPAQSGGERIDGLVMMWWHEGTPEDWRAILADLILLDAQGAITLGSFGINTKAPGAHSGRSVGLTVTLWIEGEAP